MKTKAQPRPQTRTTIAANEAFRSSLPHRPLKTSMPERNLSPLTCSTPSPMEVGDTEGPPHDQGGLCCQPTGPIGTPHHRGSQHSRTKGALRPTMDNRRQRTLRTKALRQEIPSPPLKTHVASPPGGLPDLIAKRPNERLHQGGVGFDNQQTSHHGDHQPSNPTTTDIQMAKQRPCPRSGRASPPVRPCHRCRAAPA
jgi:hypothetical protein